ncbi:hypothetical protein V8E36_001186 [Tilletia maclaganii]
MSYAYTHSCDPRIPPRTDSGNTPSHYHPQDPLLQLVKTESQDPTEFQPHHPEPLQLYAAHIATADASSDSGDDDDDDDIAPSSFLPESLERALNSSLHYVFSAYSQMTPDDRAVYYSYMRPFLSEEVTMELAKETAELLNQIGRLTEANERLYRMFRSRIRLAGCRFRFPLSSPWSQLF